MVMGVTVHNYSEDVCGLCIREFGKAYTEGKYNAIRWQYRACVTSRHSGLQRTSVSHHSTAL